MQINELQSRRRGSRQCPTTSAVIVAEEEDIGHVDGGQDVSTFGPSLTLGGQ